MFKLFVLLFFIKVAAFSQTDSLAVISLFEKSKKLYKNSDFKLNTSYKTYITTHKDSLVLQYKGKVLKRGMHSYNKMGSNEFILEKGKKLTISHSEKMVNLSTVSENGIVNQAVDVKELLPFFKNYNCTKTQNGFRCEFFAKDISVLPFSKIEIQFRMDNSIKYQILHLNRTVPYQFKGEEKHGTTRVEFYFSELQPLSPQDHIPKISNYVVEKASNLILKQEIKEYRIIN